MDLLMFGWLKWLFSVKAVALWPPFLLSKPFFLQTTALHELCLIALSSTEISSVLLGLSSHGLHESSLTFTVCNYYKNINQGQNSKDSLGFSKKLSERELKWRQHSLTAGVMSDFLLESASICNFGWHVAALCHSNTWACCKQKHSLVTRWCNFLLLTWI